MSIIWDALLHQGKPDLSATHRMPRLPQFGRTSVATVGWPDPLGTPNNQWFDSFAAAVTSPSGWFLFDHESWPVTTQAERQQAAANYVMVYQGIKSRRPDLRCGFYGVDATPRRDVFRAITLPGHANYTQWQNENNDFAPVYSVVDAIFPSCYWFYTRQVNGPWTAGHYRVYVEQNLLEARRLLRAYGKGQPIYPFVWHQRADGTALLDHDVWIEIVRRCVQLSDGVVLWGGFGVQWSTDSALAWWTDIEQCILSGREWKKDV